MNVLDLFSGIGGFSLGLERAGMRTVAFCEIEPFPRAVLAKHWPHVPCYHDVHDVTADRLDRDGVGRIDLICGGYPCQPFSHAGKQRGHEDPRHLWPQMRRVVGEVRPAWVLAENVVGHITLGLDQVLADLETDGYAARAIVVPACAKDAPHIRQRVWIMARDRDRDREPDLSVDAEVEGVQGMVADAARDVGLRGGEEIRRARQRAESGSAGRGGVEHVATESQEGATRDVADAVSKGLERYARDEGEETGRSGSQRGPTSESGLPGGSGPLLPDDGLRSGEGPGPVQRGRQEPSRWLPEPRVGRVAHGIPRRMDRLRALGNAVVPQVVEEIGRAIMACKARRA